MMGKRDFVIRTYREGDERQLVELHSTTRAIDFDRGLGIEFWTWRNKLSPYFDPSLTFIVEENGKVVGCGYVQVRNVKISRSINIRTTQPADLFVHPAYRLRGIATELTSFVRKKDRERGAFVFFGVTSPLTYSQVYVKRKIDPVFLIPRRRYCKTMYIKRLNCASIERKAVQINKILDEHPDIRKEFLKLSLNVLFRLKGFPSFVLEVSQGKVSIREGEPSYKPNVIVVASELSSSTRMSTLVKMLFSGDLKVKGFLRNFVSLYRCFSLLRRVKLELR